MSATLSLDDLENATDLTAQDDLTTRRRFEYLLDRRRVAVGPRVSLVFENREILWFRLRELARVARVTSAGHV